MDGVNVCEQTGRPEDKYREFWALNEPLTAGSADLPARAVKLFTQHRIYRLTPAEARLLADQLHAAANEADPDGPLCRCPSCLAFVSRATGGV